MLYVYRYRYNGQRLPDQHIGTETTDILRTSIVTYTCTIHRHRWSRNVFDDELQCKRDI